MQTRSNLRKGMTPREFPRTPSRARSLGTRAYPPAPWRAPRAVWGTTVLAGIKGGWGRGLAGSSQWAGEGRAGAELGFRVPIGQLALRYADTVESRARGQDDFLLEAKAGRGRGRELPVWLERGEGGFLSVRATRWPRWQLRTSARRPREPQPPPSALPPRSPERRPGRPHRP